MTGPKPSFAEGEVPHDLSWREKAVVVPIIASFIVLGFFPKPVLDLLNPAVDRTLLYVGVTDPNPTTASGSAK
jgi:NADH-quinone oxidoreductase subunit M